MTKPPLAAASRRRPPAPAAPTAKNVNDVARFPAEKALTDDDQKTGRPFTSRDDRLQVGRDGRAVKAGTDPFKIADFQDCSLVTFPDPKDATSRSWARSRRTPFTRSRSRRGHQGRGKDGASTPPSSWSSRRRAAEVRGGPGGVVNLGQAATCRKKCTADKDCKTPTTDACATSTTAAGKLTKVCANELP